MDEHLSVGERIAYWRRRRGLTQEVLAGLVGRSTVWLSRIERGERVLDKIADLLTLARVLKVEPADLIGKFSLPPNGGDPLDPPRGIPAIRRSLFSALPDRQPPDVDQLRSQLEEAKQLDGSGSYEALVLLIPDWILAGRAAATQGMPGAWWTLAGLYQV